MRAYKEFMQYLQGLRDRKKSIDSEIKALKAEAGKLQKGFDSALASGEGQKVADKMNGIADKIKLLKQEDLALAKTLRGGLKPPEYLKRQEALHLEARGEADKLNEQVEPLVTKAWKARQAYIDSLKAIGQVVRQCEQIDRQAGRWTERLYSLSAAGSNIRNDLIFRATELNDYVTGLKQ